MIHITNEKNCCGCAACAEICPTQCIKLLPATLGAMIAQADVSKCIGCNCCDNVCPINTQRAELTNQKVYAAYSKDNTIRYNGSSGGMFPTFALNLIKQGYAVYGAAFNNSLELKCTKAENENQLSSLYKSKYLQSDMSGKYSEIKELLMSGRKALFVSTPCQVQALKNYLGKEYDSLTTIDFFCHGVPSKELFDKCLKYEEEKADGKIIGFNFRSKIKNGATPHYYTASIVKNGRTKKYTKLYYNNSFYALFQKYINLRESCYSCVFSSKNRCSDITIGDFHDIEKYLPSINRFDGVSTVVINNPKGAALFDEIKNDIVHHEFDINKLIRDKVIFSDEQTTKRPKNRDAFISDYENLDFVQLINKYANPKRYIKQDIYYKMPKPIRNLLKRGFNIS